MSNAGVIKTTIGAICGIGVVVLLQFTVFDKAASSSDSDSRALLESLAKNSSSGSLLDQIANEVNKSCPKTIDSETRLDGASALPGNKFVYNYTLINKEVASTDTASIKQFMESTIHERVKSNVAFEYFRMNRVTMVFSFHDKDSKPLFSVIITPEQYAD